MGSLFFCRLKKEEKAMEKIILAILSAVIVVWTEIIRRRKAV